MPVVFIKRKSPQIHSTPHVLCKGKPIADVLSSGQWEGQTCFILGGGPSMKDLDWSSVKQYKTIGINKCFIKYPTDINYSMDHTFYDSVNNPKYDAEMTRKWKEYKGIKIFLKENFPYNEDVYVINGLSKCISRNLAEGIFPSIHSGHGALMLAIALGCRKIGLLGYDFCTDGNKTHWHGGYKNQFADHMKSQLRDYRIATEEWAEAISSIGILVANLSNHSELQRYPRMSMEEFLKK